MARPKLGDSDSKRMQMVITEDELEAVDVWQHENRVPSKSEAIRRLVQIGLVCDQPMAIASRGISDLYEMCRLQYNALGTLQSEAQGWSSNVFSEPVEKVRDEAREIVEKLEYLQLLVQSAENQVTEISEGSEALDNALAAARDWKSAAADHLKRVRRRQAARAKKRTL